MMRLSKRHLLLFIVPALLIMLAGCNFPPGRAQTDRDGDTVLDRNDDCPALWSSGGGIEGSGCPAGPEGDTDADGVNDGTDLCPAFAAGASGVDGCPNGPNADADNDGVRDDVDQCPEQVGVISTLRQPGCPG